MPATVVYEELSEEGKKIWDNILSYESLANGKSLLPKARRVRLNMFEVELVFIRLELRKMIENSKRVIKDCNQIIEAIKDKDEYLSCDAKVASQIHANLIDRLQRVLDSHPAFDHEIDVDDEPKRPYYGK